jgi:FdhE protein
LLRIYVRNRGGVEGIEPASIPHRGAACPQCDSPPLIAILRPAAEGAARSLLCSACLTEWPVNRLICPSCGEHDHNKLPVYAADQFPHVRIDACDTCRGYLKTIDLTRNGLAIPEVDDIASIAFDLWAQEQGYFRLHPNLLGL